MKEVSQKRCDQKGHQQTEKKSDKRMLRHNLRSQTKHTWLCCIPGEVEAIPSNRMVGAEPQVYCIMCGDDGAIAAWERGATVPAKMMVTAAGSIMDLWYHKAM